MIVKRGYKCKSNMLKILFCYLFIIICIRVCVHSRCEWFEHDGNHVIHSRLDLSINPPLFTVTIQAKTSSNQLIHEVSPHYEPISTSSKKLVHSLITFFLVLKNFWFYSMSASYGDRILIHNILFFALI